MRVHPRDSTKRTPAAAPRCGAIFEPTSDEWPASRPRPQVTIVTGLVELPANERQGHRVGKPEAGDYYIVPETLTMFYNVKDSDSSTASSVGPIEFQNCEFKLGMSGHAVEGGGRLSSARV